jgi:radical SAM superfamily enzyme YgiQ (UPF0313 family)
VEGSKYMPFPFFLAHSSSLLKKHGYEVLIVDGCAEKIKEDEFLNRAVNFKPDLVVLEVSSASFNVDQTMIKSIHQNIPNARIALCGIHMKMFEQSFMEEHPYVDFVLKGEYEMTLLDLADHLRDGKNYLNIPGAGVRSGDQVVFNPNRELLKNLDDLPWPDRDFLPAEKYHDTPGGIPTPSAQMIASRGCPFQCIFCAWPQMMYDGNKYRVRSPEDIVSEMLHLRDKYGIKSAYFDDDTFNIGTKRMMKLGQEMIDREVNIPWAAMGRADTTGLEVLEKLHEAGLVAIKYGVESGDQEVIDKSGKNLKLSVVRDAVKKTKELGIDVHLTFTFGLPGETWETARKTIDLAIELDPDTIQFSVCTPFPGSSMYELYKEKGHLEKGENWDEYDGFSSSIIRTEDMSAKDLEDAMSLAQKTWDEHVRMRDLAAGGKKSKFYYFKKGILHPIQAARKVKEMMAVK